MSKTNIGRLITIVMLCVFSIIAKEIYFTNKYTNNQYIYEIFETNDRDAIKNVLSETFKKNPRDGNRYFYLGYIYYLEGNFEEAKEKFQRALNMNSLNSPREFQLRNAEVMIKALIDMGEKKEAEKAIKQVFNKMNLSDFNTSYEVVWDILRHQIDMKDGFFTLRYNVEEILAYKNLDIRSKIFFLRKMEGQSILDREYLMASEYIIKILSLSDYEDLNYYKGKALVDLSIVVKNLGSSKLSMEILNSINFPIKDSVKEADLEIYKKINLAQNNTILGNGKEALKDLEGIDLYLEKIPGIKKLEIYYLKKIKQIEAYVSLGNLKEAEKLILDIYDEDVFGKSKYYKTIEIDYRIALGNFLMASERYEEAIKVYEEILTRTPIGCDYIDNEEALIGIIRADKALGNMEEALKSEERLKSIQDEWENYKVSMLYKYVEESKELGDITQKNESISRNYIFTLMVLLFFIVIFIKFLLIPIYKIKIKKRLVIKNMKNNNYFNVYQPIVNPKTNKIQGVETLIRMKKDGKFIPPDLFLEDIRLAGMMEDIALWQLKEIKNNIEELLKVSSESPSFYVSINISLEEIKNEKFIEKLKREAEQFKNDEITICLEITENVGIVDDEQIKTNINKLIEIGYKIAVDDFGIEYSNISMLDKFEFHILKLDKYFIDNLKESVVVQNIFKVVNDISEELEIRVVVEGVEEKWQLDLIEDYSKNKLYIQGFYYSKPLEVKELKELTIE